jgi:hypothetical protein
MEEKPVTVKSEFTRFDDALSKVELDKYATPTIEIDPVSLTRISFPYSNVLMGNSLDFNVNLDPGMDSVSTIQKNHLEQRIFIEDYDKIKRRLQFQINTGAAFVVDGDANQITYYQCQEENKLTSQCRIAGSFPTHGITFNDHFTSTSGVATTLGFKVVNPEETKPEKIKTFYYFNWFNFNTKQWDYEVYDKQILEVGHTITANGETYSIIAFKNSIKVGRFFSGWTYGNRDVTEFDNSDMDIDSFCPSNIMFNANERNVFFVLSVCEGTQNLVKFEIQDRTPKFVESRWIGSEAKPLAK